MEINWPKTPAEAIALQKQMAHKVKLADDFDKITTIAGIDCSLADEGRISRAYIVLMKYPSLEIITTAKAIMPTVFPYIPGLLSFREIPVILEAFKQLSQKPDLLMVDGQGIAHPRRLGIAAHLGVLLDIPAIGVAKSLLTGKYIEPGATKLSQSELTDKGEKIGVVLRSKEKCKPLIISPGHRVSFDTAIDIVIKCLTKYRLPEPTRIADKISKIREKEPENLLI